ncbi:putative uracil phosphoribosyltransferase, partial [Globisporangium splendens]
MEFSRPRQNESEHQDERTTAPYQSIEQSRQYAQFPWRPYSAAKSEPQTFDSLRYHAGQLQQGFELPRVVESRVTRQRDMRSVWTREQASDEDAAQLNSGASAQAHVLQEAHQIPLVNGNSNSSRFMPRATRDSVRSRSTSFGDPQTHSRPYNFPLSATHQSSAYEHFRRTNSEHSCHSDEDESRSEESDSSSNAVRIHNAKEPSRDHDEPPRKSIQRRRGTQNQKPPRYLREMDRREILARIDEGESQSSLAREYNVSRSAICNLNKKRDQVLARRHENPYAMHIKMNRTKPRSRSKLSASGILNGVFDPALDAAPGVHKIQTRAVVLLLSTLLDKTTSDAIFARSADRLMRIFMEEATAFIQMRNKVGVRNDHEATINSDETDGTLNGSPSAESNPRALCAITMEQQHCPMLEHLHMVESDLPSGYARFHPRHPENLTRSGRDEEVRESPIVTLLSANLSESLDQQSVMLLDSFLYEDGYSTLDGVIEQVLSRGAVEKHIAVLTLFISSEVAERISRKYPDILILAVDIGGSPQEFKKYDSIRSKLLVKYQC